MGDTAELNSTQSAMYERNFSTASTFTNGNFTLTSNELNIDFNLLRKEILTLYSILTGISFVNALGMVRKIVDSIRTRNISVRAY